MSFIEKVGKRKFLKLFSMCCFCVHRSGNILTDCGENPPCWMLHDYLETSFGAVSLTLLTSISL